MVIEICDWMKGNEEPVDEDKIDGVINVDLKACVPYNIESIPLKRFVNEKKDMEYINLETNMMAEEVGQIRTRIEAFLEMVKEENTEMAI